MLYFCTLRHIAYIKILCNYVYNVVRDISVMLVYFFKELETCINKTKKLFKFSAIKLWCGEN